MKATVVIIFMAVGIVSGISLMRYARAQAALIQERTSHEHDRSRLATIVDSRALSDSVEGLIMDESLLSRLRYASGEIVNLDTHWFATDDVPTVIVLFSLLGCGACLNQELDIIESDSLALRGKCRVLYVCTDSLDTEQAANFSKFHRARRLKFPACRDSIDLVRRSLRITTFSIAELVVLNRRILYALKPSSADRDASLRFLKKVRRLVESSRRATS